MTSRRGTAIASGALIVAVAAVSAGSGLAETAGPLKPPVGVIEDCSSQSGASFPGFTNRFPGAFTSRRNLVVGPLALIGARGTPVFADSFSGNKFPALVRAGHRVTIELSRRIRGDAGLAYGPLELPRVRLRDAHRVVTFVACRRAEQSRSIADGRPVTFWAGGVLARSPRCVPPLVWVDAESSPRQAVVRLGVRSCR